MNPLATLANHIIPLLIKILRQLSPQCLAPLKEHEGKVVCFALENFPALYFRVTEQGFIPLDPCEHCDTTLSGPLRAFMTTLFTKQRLQTGLHIKGDIPFAKAIDDCWQQLHIDWEAHLAKGFGDELAHLMMKTLKEAKSWASNVRQARTEDLGAYLQDETNLLPPQGEVQAFYQEVDTLRHDVERFAAKVELLQQGSKHKD